MGFQSWSRCLFHRLPLRKDSHPTLPCLSLSSGQVMVGAPCCSCHRGVGRRVLCTRGSMLDSAWPQICQGQSVLRLMFLPLATLGSAWKRALPRCTYPCHSCHQGAPSLDFSLLHHALTEMAVFTEARTGPADGPKEPPQSVRFVFGKGCVGHYEEGSRGA